MKNSYTLYQKKGYVDSTDIFFHNEKICIRDSSSGGEHLMYISNQSEIALLKALGPKNGWLWALNKFVGKPVSRERTLQLIAQKFTTKDNSPYVAIQHFLKKNDIKYTSEYWPDSDRF
ncbi:MAG: hypothetical protein ACFB0A_16725 [Croceivirga sp.]